MASFISGFSKNGGGYPIINIDRVDRFDPVLDDDGKIRSYECIIGDECVGQIGSTHPSRSSSDYSIIPTDRPADAITFGWNDDTKTVEHERQPVIAWRTDGTSIEPVVFLSLDCYFWVVEMSVTEKPVWLCPEREEMYQNWGDVKAAAEKVLKAKMTK